MVIITGNYHICFVSLSSRERQTKTSEENSIINGPFLLHNKSIRINSHNLEGKKKKNNQVADHTLITTEHSLWVTGKCWTELSIASLLKRDEVFVSSVLWTRTRCLPSEHVWQGRWFSSPALITPVQIQLRSPCQDYHEALRPMLSEQKWTVSLLQSLVSG